MSVLVMDIRPLMATPGAINLQDVDIATGPVLYRNIFYCRRIYLKGTSHGKVKT